MVGIVGLKVRRGAADFLDAPRGLVPVLPKPPVPLLLEFWSKVISSNCGWMTGEKTNCAIRWPMDISNG